MASEGGGPAARSRYFGFLCALFGAFYLLLGAAEVILSFGLVGTGPFSFDVLVGGVMIVTGTVFISGLRHGFSGEGTKAHYIVGLFLAILQASTEALIILAGLLSLLVGSGSEIGDVLFQFAKPSIALGMILISVHILHGRFRHPVGARRDES